MTQLRCWPYGCACAWLLQGAGDVLDRPRGWSLAHLASALARPAMLAFLLAQGVPATGASHPNIAGSLGSAVNLNRLPELLDRAHREEGWLYHRQCEGRAERSLMLLSQPLLHTTIHWCTIGQQNRKKKAARTCGRGWNLLAVV